jgi:hypothetical protein
MSTNDELFATIYEKCGLINWTQDEIKKLADQAKAAQVEIERAARQIQSSRSTVNRKEVRVNR